MEIRPATIDDAELIANHVTAMTKQHLGSSLEAGGIETLLASMDLASTKQRLLDGWLHFCAMDDNKLLGVIVLRPPTHLYHFFVRTDRQHMGLGRQLFEYADDRLFEARGCRIATVNSSLNAVPVYERLGFIVEGPVNCVAGVKSQPMVRRSE